MGTFVQTCPHCLAESVAFSIFNDRGHPSDGSIVFSTAACGHCHFPVSLRIRKTHDSASPANWPGRIDAPNANIHVLNAWPQIKDTVCPKDCPPRVEATYLEAMDALKRKNWNSAGMMFRRTLELATRKLDESLSGKTLAKRIDILGEKNLITPAMKDWAHAIRLDGNDAAHDDEDFDAQTATALQSFTETFLLYAFTMPAMVASRQPPAAPSA